MKRHFTWLTLLALLLALVGSAVSVTPVYAASIVVNSNGDTIANDGQCTLREALIAAQQNAPTGGCTAGSGADIITFASNYTITLGSQLAVASPVTIQGKGAEHTIIQANASPIVATYRVFEVASQGNLMLENLTVRHGTCNGTCTSPSNNSPNGGAGIWNAGTLAVINSTLSNNFAVGGGAIWNEGSLTVTNSVFSRNEAASGGGAIWNVGTLTVTGSTFSDNSAASGGGLRTNGGSANLTNSTFSSNSAQIRGGGIFNDQPSTMTVTNSTFSGNSAQNGGGIYNGAAITLKNTIVADNPSGGNCAGTITNGGSNLDSGATCGWGSAGGSLSNTNSNLGLLADNGGLTKTHALMPGSPAIAKGMNCPSTDQRGVTRPQGALCDMGAYETYSIVVNSNADTIADDGVCTLREAIIAANDNVATGGCPAGSATGTDSIRISVNSPITLAGSQLPVVTSPMIIAGAGPEKTIIQAAASPNVATDQVFEVWGNLTLNQLTVRHGVCWNPCNGLGFGSAGGAIFNGGFLTIINSVISDNSALAGGAIFNYRILTVTNSVFSGNSATHGGGGIYNFYSTAPTHEALLTVTNSTFSGNSTGGTGGGISTIGWGTVTNSTFSGNSAVDGGGGIAAPATGANLTLENTIIANNTGGNCLQRFLAMINDGGGNLSWPDATCPGLNADPLLGPLADNGGPTQTMALQSGSAAIDAANNVDCPDVDQRGGARPQGSPCDIGAYEFGATIIVIPTFSDVLQSYWAWDFIERLYAAGITGGCVNSPLSYCPEATVTRAQMAVFLLRGIHGAAYVPPAIGAGSGFGDVPPSYWAATFIKQLAAEGITTGCGGSFFCPDQPVTRAQMAVFLLRSKHGASYTPPSVGAGTGFGDVPPSYWAAAWIKQLVTEGITSGCGGGNYCPEQPVTRAQMAVFLVRTFNLP